MANCDFIDKNIAHRWILVSVYWRTSSRSSSCLHRICEYPSKAICVQWEWHCDELTRDRVRRSWRMFWNFVDLRSDCSFVLAFIALAVRDLRRCRRGNRNATLQLLYPETIVAWSLRASRASQRSCNVHLRIREFRSSSRNVEFNK